MSYGEGRPDYSIRKEVPFEDSRGYGVYYYNSNGVLVGEGITHVQMQLELELNVTNSDEQIETESKVEEADPEAWKEERVGSTVE